MIERVTGTHRISSSKLNVAIVVHIPHVCIVAVLVLLRQKKQLITK